MKTGIVLEGGALRTIFSSGACDALLDNDIMTDYVIGVSAGIAYGTSYVSKQTGRNLEILTKYAHTKDYMGWRHLIDPSNRSYFNIRFTYDRIPNELVLFDYDEFNKYEGEVEAVVTNLLTGKPRYYKVSAEDKTFKVLQASCSMPLLFPIVYLNSTPCLDGGISDAIPFKRAFQKGCDRVIVVLTREREYVKTPESMQALMNVYYSAYPEFCKAMKSRAERYNETREDLFELERQGKVLVICPDSTEGFSRTERNTQKIKELYQNGYDKVMNRIDEIREFLY